MTRESSTFAEAFREAFNYSMLGALLMGVISVVAFGLLLAIGYLIVAPLVDLPTPLVVAGTVIVWTTAVTTPAVKTLETTVA